MLFLLALFAGSALLSGGVCCCGERLVRGEGQPHSGRHPCDVIIARRTGRPIREEQGFHRRCADLAALNHDLSDLCGALEADHWTGTYVPSCTRVFNKPDCLQFSAKLDKKPRHNLGLFKQVGDKASCCALELAVDPFHSHLGWTLDCTSFYGSLTALPAGGPLPLHTSLPKREPLDPLNHSRNLTLLSNGALLIRTPPPL